MTVIIKQALRAILLTRYFAYRFFNLHNNPMRQSYYFHLSRTLRDMSVIQRGRYVCFNWRVHSGGGVQMQDWDPEKLHDLSEFGKLEGRRAGV